MTIYLDDLLIYSGNEVDQEVYLFQIFDNLCEETLFVKHKKCKFGKDSVEYLNHIFRQGHVYMDPSEA